MKRYSKRNVTCHCGLPTRVTRTLSDEGGRVRRERVCSRGHKSETVERLVAPRPRLTPQDAAKRRWSA